MVKTSVNNRGYTSTSLSLAIIFMTGILAFLASPGMEIPRACATFLIGCFGSGVWLFCVIIWADGGHFIRDKPIPPWLVVTFYILIGGAITWLFGFTPDAEIVIFFRGFSWPGIFISVLSAAKVSRLILNGGQAISELSDEPTDIGETEL